MAHDFAGKRKNKPKQPAKKPLPGWIWLTTGFAGGLFISFLVYLVALMPSASQYDTLASVIQEKAVQKPQAKETKKKATEKPRFDFYTLLPKSEVTLPEQETTAVETRHSNKQAAKYSLQAGAFRKLSDADQRRAKLLLMGLDAEIKTVQGKNQSTWHRVQVGPFNNRSQIAKVRGTLISNGIDTLVLTEKAG